MPQEFRQRKAGSLQYGRDLDDLQPGRVGFESPSHNSNEDKNTVSYAQSCSQKNVPSYQWIAIVAGLDAVPGNQEPWPKFSDRRLQCQIKEHEPERVIKPLVQ